MGSKARPKGKRLKRPNGSGTVVFLSGRRRNPYEVRVNTRMDERNYPVYDVLGRYEDAITAETELNLYLRDPYDIDSRKATFKDIYEVFYKRKYENGRKVYSESTKYCTKSAYKYCEALHNCVYSKLRTNDFVNVLDQYVKGVPLSHAMQEHIKNLFNQMDAYALEYDIIAKSYSTYAKITVDEDDEPGVPFSSEELKLLWQNKDVPWIDTILILCYSGWRITEILTMPKEDIDLKEWTFKGGIKTAAGKNRIVPIHSCIQKFVLKRMDYSDNIIPSIRREDYYKPFHEALISIGIKIKHTPHDCRHTFSSLLDSAGANPVCIDRLIGHASKSLTKKTYTHKDIEELRMNIELVKPPIL